jgi:hypothetical protein
MTRELVSAHILFGDLIQETLGHVGSLAAFVGEIVADAASEMVMPLAQIEAPASAFALDAAMTNRA